MDFKSLGEIFCQLLIMEVVRSLETLLEQTHVEKEKTSSDCFKKYGPNIATGSSLVRTRDFEGPRETDFSFSKSGRAGENV